MGGAGDAADDAAVKLVKWDAFEEVLKDGKIQLTQDGDKGDVLVHEGFNRQYNSGRDSVYSAITGYLEVGLRKLSICGHSLGGALTTLAALDLSQRFPQIELI